MLLLRWQPNAAMDVGCPSATATVRRRTARGPRPLLGGAVLASIPIENGLINS